ncbi:MAG: sugar transferase [Clostridia bacterium]|nr:sugar transferase [Clostridia bacterium]
MTIWHILLIAAGLGITAAAVCKKPSSVYRNRPDEQNPFEGKTVRFIADDQDPVNADGVRGHLEVTGTARHTPSFYEKYLKRGMDMLFSLLGLVVLSPLFILLMLAIRIDDPGPAVFSQRRVGKNKRFFALHKFRSMKMSAPHDVPTHMLAHPEQYITGVGRFMRRFSLDELPQLWDVLLGNMSLVGPRPALWNQDTLTAERDKWNANDILPGLTGWAQVNGRDELGIQEKAKLDGEYRRNLTFKMDVTCFLMTIANVLKGCGIVEGGTGAIARHIDRRRLEIEAKK